jgi:hypothetical protein
MRSINADLGVVNLPDEPFGALHGHFEVGTDTKDRIFIFETVTADEIESAVAVEKALLVQDETLLQEQAEQLKVAFQPKQHLRHGISHTEKWVISFGLYGSNPKYVAGALRNVQVCSLKYKSKCKIISVVVVNSFKTVNEHISLNIVHTFVWQ